MSPPLILRSGGSKLNVNGGKKMECEKCGYEEGDDGGLMTAREIYEYMRDQLAEGVNIRLARKEEMIREIRFLIEND